MNYLMQEKVKRFGILVIMVFFFVSCSVINRDKKDVGVSGRTVLKVSKATQDEISKEMRETLLILNTIMNLLAEGNYTMVEKSASSMGLVRAGEHQEMRDYIWEHQLREWRMNGRAMHAQFDRIAAVANATQDTNAVLKEVGKLYGFCIGCHELFSF